MSIEQLEESLNRLINGTDVTTKIKTVMPSISIRGSSIYYRDLGSGVPVVLSPGGRSPLDLVMPLAEKLATKCRVILWDRSNLGRSDVAFDGCSDNDMWADQLFDLVRLLDVSPVYLAAASSGARLSLRFALRYPTAVRGLFLWLMTGGPIADLLSATYYSSAACVAAEHGMNGVIAMAYWAERIRANPANLERMLARDPEEFAATMRRWALSMRADDLLIGITEDELRRVTTRTRLVACSGDPAHDAARTQRVAALMPNADLINPQDFGLAWVTIRARVEVGTGYELVPLLPDLIADFLSEEARF